MAQAVKKLREMRKQNEMRAARHIKKWEMFMERAARELLQERGLSRRLFVPKIKSYPSLLVAYQLDIPRLNIQVYYSEVAAMTDEELLRYINGLIQEQNEDAEELKIEQIRQLCKR